MLHFTKVHGNGNDFIVLDNMQGVFSSAELAQYASVLCRRKFAIGADGILVLEKPDSAALDFRMRIFNADGSEGEMCGNGARAIARYAFEKGIGKENMCFSTGAGNMHAKVCPPFVELDMGELDLTRGIYGELLSVEGIDFPYVFLTVGVPHCILLTEEYDDLSADSKAEIGRAVSHDRKRFPDRANVSFVQVLSGSELKAVTYERGVEDLTESCGTGSVAAALAGILVRGCYSPVKVINPGGVNEVRIEFKEDRTRCRAYLKGKTALVASGEILEEAWL